jgi:CotS family spore coat protein
LEGQILNDRAVALLEQYDIEVLHTRKGRGAILCDTDVGCLIFKTYAGNINRLTVQDKLLKHIKNVGNISAEMLIPSKEGELYVKDNDGICYILKTYREGTECNVYDRDDCVNAVKLSAKLHKVMMEYSDVITADDDTTVQYTPGREYEKRNRELKHVRRFLMQRHQKTQFELELLNNYNFFLEQALEVTEKWNEYSSHIPTGQMTYCHGDYQYHNILKTGNEWFIINFERYQKDDGIRDLYLLMRKIMEKNNWQISLGKELLKAYSDESTLDDYSRTDLYYRMAYPEKFWKIVNFYNNSRKTWIPGKNAEKLDKVIMQEPVKKQFIDEVLKI